MIFQSKKIVGTKQNYECQIFFFPLQNCVSTKKTSCIKTPIKRYSFSQKNRNAENDENRDYDSFIDLCAESIYLFCCFSLMSII